ncbi:hypothetical protein ACYTPF_00585 [Alteromonas sp. HB246098]
MEYEDTMKFLYEWIGDTKKTIDILGVSTFLVYISLLLISYFKVNLSNISWTFLMSLLIILPFGILVSIITNNKIFKKVTSTLWSKSLISIGLVVYTAMSNVWASTLINEIYGVAANHFGITQIFLTLAYFVITIMKLIFSGLFISIIALGVLPLWYVVAFKDSIKSKAYGALYFCVIFILVAVTYTIIGLFDRDIKIFAERAALWGDFYPNNKCTKDLGKNKGVIFLSPNKVLTATPVVQNNNKVHWNYPIKQCL